LRSWEANSVLRGQRLAQDLGCPACHFPPQGAEIPNPGSRWGSVPRFGGGNIMMYAESVEEIGQFIRHGAPDSWLEQESSRLRLESQRLRMPAYEDRLSEAQIADLVAYVQVEESLELPSGARVEAGRADAVRVEAGRALARRHGCPSCHGAEGAGGQANPGSLGGFIPGFLGKNFEDLVEDEAEFREWVRTGTSARLAAQPWVSFFWRRQKISMPAYGDSVSDEDLANLWAWIEASRAAFATP
jgi:mono/diheme cytochrome c family protein